MIDDQQVYYLMDIIKEIRATEKINRKMSDTLILIDSLDNDIKKKAKGGALRTYLNKYMKDKLFRRSVDIRNKMMSDTEEALCYLSEDYITDQEHLYDEKLELKIREIDERIRIFLAVIIKELVSEEFKM